MCVLVPQVWVGACAASEGYPPKQTEYPPSLLDLILRHFSFQHQGPNSFDNFPEIIFVTAQPNLNLT